MFFSLFRAKQSARTRKSQGVFRFKPRLEALEQREVPAALGWAVGSDGDGGGTILHTSDGGANWSLQKDVPGISFLRGVDFADTQNGWAVGGAGTILHTSDGGSTWSPQSSGYGRTIYSVTFLDAQNGWAAGQGPGSLSAGTTGIGTVYHTTNGGASWSFQHVGLDRYRGTSSFFDIDFADTQHGVATGNSFLGGNERYRTTDGGATWTSLDVPGFTLGPVDFVDAQHGWGAGFDVATGNTVILFSSDAGATWSPQFNQAGVVLRDIAFTDANNGWAVGNDGVIVHTGDGGATWSVQYTIGESLVGAAATDALNSWAVGLGGGIVHTDDGGASWSPQESGGTNPLFGVDFVKEALTVTPTVTLTAANAIYTGSAYDTANLIPTVTPASASGSVSYVFYSDAGGQNPIATPINAGTNYVQAFFTSSSSGYTDAKSSIVSFNIAKANASFNVTPYSGTYDGLAHNITVVATGVGSDGDLSSLVTLGSNQTNAGSYTGTWSFAGNGNYNPASGNAAITITAKSLTVDATTQGTLNIAKAGTISFALQITGGLIASNNDVATLFNGAVFTIVVDGTDYSLTSTATVALDGTINVSMKMSQGLQNALLTALSEGNTVDFSLSALSNDGDYSIAADAISRLISQGKLKFAVV